MPRLILKSPYIKPGGGAGDYLRYIATREGVDFIPQARRDLPATRKQQQLIRRVLADFPDCATLAEHEDYQSSPTIGNASAFLHVAMEADLAAMVHAETYLKYIATRRGAERQGAHGLFGDERHPSLEAVAQEAARHTGNVWTHIISLRREDAARLGFDSADAWRSLLLSKRNDIADLMKIPPDDFRWFAAYHDAGHHPHVHMAVWSADPRRGFLTEKGLKSIRALLAKEIFRQDLISIYARKTRYRDEAVRASRDRMAELASALGRGVHDAPELERDVLDLAERLERSSGKKQYGYLSPRLKELVDRIADQLGALPQVSAALDHWWEMQCEVYRTYHDETPDRLPLSKLKDFRPIQNAIIKEAVNIAAGTITFEGGPLPLPDPPLSDPDGMETSGLPQSSADGGGDPPPPSAPPAAAAPPAQMAGDSGSPPPFVQWTASYKAALEALRHDPAEGFRLLQAEAALGSALAMSDLGRLCAKGLGCELSPERSQSWYAKALAAFQRVEAAAPQPYTQYRIGKHYAQGLGAEQDYEKAARWFGLATDDGYKYAQYSLAGLRARGNGVPKDLPAALELYRASANQGFPFAAYELGKMCRDGVGCAPDREQADRWLRSAYAGFLALEHQRPDDQLEYRIGQMLYSGTGVEKDEAAALPWLERSAAQGNVNAQYRMAILWLSAPDADREKVEKALAWLEEAAGKDVPQAQYALGRLCRDGLHIVKDPERAAALFRRAAELGSDCAAFALGKLLLAGGDPVQAVAWFTKAAEAGNQYAAYQLGKAYLTGTGVPHSTADAVKWLTASAEAGDQYAQYLLGKLYLLGKDVPQDREAALEWLTRSAAQGNVYARYFLDHMNDRSPAALLFATRILGQLEELLRDTPAPKPHHAIDRRLRSKIKEKKIAMGQAVDDHEPYV